MACLGRVGRCCGLVGAVTDKPPVQSVAGRVLATGEATPDEARRLAAAVLGDDSLTPASAKTRDELEALAAKLEGVEGQTERLAAIRAKLERMG